MSNSKKIVSAMSGGVDSSVATALLKKSGFDVIGVFMRFWSEATEKKGNNTLVPLMAIEGESNKCCSQEAETRARAVANYLKIPFYVFNFENEFKKRVVDYFVKEYKEGRTPNPCVVCNKQIKFGLLLEKALTLNADFVATGHYVKKVKTQKSVPSNGEGSKVKGNENQDLKICYKLFRSKDKIKDQSYFLWQLSQNQLKHIVFPLGDYTKPQVKNLAKKFKLPVLNIPESQEICFVNTNLNDFLKSRIKVKKGDIIDSQGKKIGLHQGLAFYTIGQRKGIKLPMGPFYVIKKDFKNNNLIVACSFDNKNLYKKTLIAEDVNWISDYLNCHPGAKRTKRSKVSEAIGSRSLRKESLKILAQIRYGHQAVEAILTKKLQTTTYKLIFFTPQRAITPGQSVVFYKGDELLGGGIISMNLD